jgi:hypothetical protein
MIDSKWSKNKEKFIIEVRDSIIISALHNGHSVIIDDTNLQGTHVEDITKLVEVIFSDSIPVEINDSFLEVPIETCIERDRKRESTGGKVGRNTIIGMAMRSGLITEEPNQLHTCDATREWLKWDENLPDCIICDLDGTLSIMNNNRSPFEAKKCLTDLENIPVAKIIRDYAERDVDIILFSGRSDDGEVETKQWLVNHNIPYTKLVMRVDGDGQSDTTLKEDMYKTHIEGNYNVLFVMDDRNCVVDKWRELGLLCLQVYYGNH